MKLKKKKRIGVERRFEIPLVVDGGHAPVRSHSEHIRQHTHLTASRIFDPGSLIPSGRYVAQKPIITPPILEYHHGTACDTVQLLGNTEHGVIRACRIYQSVSASDALHTCFPREPIQPHRSQK